MYGVNYYPNERRYLGDELAEEWGRSYAAILGNMTGLAIRSEARTPSRQKTLKSEVAGMRRALFIILRVVHDMDEEDAEKLVKAHEQRWRDATAKDEASLESAQ